MIIWNDNRSFSIGEVNFKRKIWGARNEQSTLEELLVFKERWMVDRYAALIKNHQPKRIFELGMDRGGSCVFFHKLANAEKLVTGQIGLPRMYADSGLDLADEMQTMAKAFGVEPEEIQERVKGGLGEVIAALEEVDVGLHLTGDGGRHGVGHAGLAHANRSGQ